MVLWTWPLKECTPVVILEDLLLFLFSSEQLFCSLLYLFLTITSLLVHEVTLRKHRVTTVNNSSVVSAVAHWGFRFSDILDFRRDGSLLVVHNVFSVLTPHQVISCVVSIYRWREKHTSWANRSFRHSVSGTEHFRGNLFSSETCLVCLSLYRFTWLYSRQGMQLVRCGKSSWFSNFSLFWKHNGFLDLDMLRFVISPMGCIKLLLWVLVEDIR